LLQKEWVDQQDAIERVALRYAISLRDETPCPASFREVEMIPEEGGARNRRVRVLELPRRFQGQERYFLHHHFRFMSAGGREEQSDSFCEEIVADESFTFVDYEGAYTNICIHWSIDGWGAPNYSAMFVDGISLDHPLSSLHLYRRSQDREYIEGRFRLLQSMPLPHVFRGKVHGPRGAQVNYCYHIVANRPDESFAFWDNNAGLDYRKLWLGASAWEDFYGKNMEPHTIEGNLKVFRALYSPQLECCRDIYVYLPPSYYETAQPYPVIYMQDGQNLFDRATSYAGEWCVDETMQTLSREGKEAIIVGVTNGGERRLREYNPYFSNQTAGNLGDRYVRFLVETVKPRVDECFRTRRGRDSTGIAGSSMGACVSLYAFFAYPEVFGSLGALSHWMWLRDELTPADVLDFVEESEFVEGKIYLDVGTAEYVDASFVGIDVDSQEMLRGARRLAELLRRKGYRPKEDLLYFEDEGGGHREADWARRLPNAMRFLLANSQSPK
jgi:predicted alpha/beta superfamily hydrolase